VLNNATLVFNRFDAFTFDGVISGTGAVVVGGANGTLTLTGNNSYSGGTTISSFAKLAVSSDANLGAASGGLNFQNGTLRFLSSFETSRAVTIGIGAVVDVGRSTDTMSGVISGPGALASLVKTGTGTLILSGNNTYNGGTVISAGTLQLGNGGATGSIVGDVVDNGILAFNRSDVVTFGGAISGNGVTSQIGSGTTILTGVSTYTGATNVNAGTLSVNGSIASSSLTTVNAGGTLGGNGTVGNTTINGGTLAPGNSIGLLTVQGNLVMTAASSYMIEVSPANADRTNVTGTATLGGASVKASFAPGAYMSRQYTIINAAAGVSGTFNSLVNTNLSNNLTSSLSYDANNAYLNLVLHFGLPSILNGNQQQVGNALTNFFNTTGGIPLMFAALTPTGLTQAAGETATGSQQTTFNAMTQFMGVMTDPFIAGRGDGVTAGAGATPFVDESDAASAYAANGKSRAQNERDAYAAVYRKAPVPADPFTQRWSVWAAGYGGSQTTDGNAALGSNNTRSSLGGVAVGADYRFSPYTIAGFALAGGATNFSVNGLGSGRSDLFQAGAFVRHTVGAAYLTGALAYGWQDVTTDRTVTIAGADLLRANFNANAFSGRVEGGYRFVTPWIGGVGITPYAAGQFTTFDLPAYAEQAIAGANTFALSYAGKSVTDTRSELGLRSDKSFAVPNGIFTLRGRAAWAHDFNTDRSITPTFQTLPGASFVVNGAAPAHDSALVTASAEMKWLNGFSLAATFEGEFSDVTRSYAGKGVARYAW
jgi:autotransporter-associated beta strand protein